jgi:hypothetical protein
MPALEETHDQDRSHPIDLPAGPALKRPIVWAGTLSALLHLLLFSVLGLPSFHSSVPSPVPEMWLRLEAAAQGATARDAASPVEPPAAPAGRTPEELLTAAASARPVATQSRPRMPAPTAEPAEAATASESSAPAPADDSVATATASTGPAHADAPAGESPLLTTESVSDRTVPVPAEAASAPPPGIVISSGQESMLSRWVVQAVQHLQEANLTQARLSLQHRGHRYTARLERHPAADAMGIDRVSVEITTEEDGKLLHTLLQLKRLAFSHFTQFVDDWDPADQLHADAIEGRFHSNSELQLLYDRFVPRVAGKLTTAAVRVNVENGGSRALREIFRGGIETRTPRIALPAASPSFAPAPGTSVQSFARGTRVNFYPDGSYGWREMGSSGPEQRQQMSAPHYIVAAAGITLTVRGTVRGTVVVYSPERIVIEGSLRYAHDPNSDPDAGDYLALISNRDVEIGPRNLTGPGDLEVQAAIYARRRFVVSDYESPDGKTTCPCAATLLIRGSLAAGSLSPTEPRYATHYAFDQRFEQVRPPGFPVTDRYEVESWDPEWREAEADSPEAPAAPALQ